MNIVLFTLIFLCSLSNYIVKLQKMVPLKWGIVGAGKISHDFVTAVQLLPITEHKVVAVAGRNKTNVEKFAREHKIPKWYDDYSKLAEDSNVDIVYIGNLNPQHFNSTKLMLEHNKNVLCEKPFTMNEKQTRKLIQIARKKKLFLMEAVWSRCFPAYKEMRRIIDSGEIGEVHFASVNFGFPLQQVDRLRQKDLGGGAILDLGVYILQFQQFIFRGLKPIKIVANGNKNIEQVDESAGAVITYPGNKMAVVATSSRVSLDNIGIVSGTKGMIKLPNFWSPTELMSPNGTKTWPLPESKEQFNHKNSAGLMYEAEEARKCIMEGKLESPQITHEESIELARLMDLMRKEVGVEFPEDSQEF